MCLHPHENRQQAALAAVDGRIILKLAEAILEGAANCEAPGVGVGSGRSRCNVRSRKRSLVSDRPHPIVSEGSCYLPLVKWRKILPFPDVADSSIRIGIPSRPT
jgi:hypothetical protein